MQLSPHMNTSNAAPGINAPSLIHHSLLNVSTVCTDHFKHRPLQIPPTLYYYRIITLRESQHHNYNKKKTYTHTHKRMKTSIFSISLKVYFTFILQVLQKFSDLAFQHSQTTRGGKKSYNLASTLFARELT